MIGEAYFSQSGKKIPFVGRQRELQVVRDISMLARSERISQFVSITGAKGAGKSRLLQELHKDLTERDKNIVVTRATGGEGDIPTQLVRSHFDIYFPACSADEKVERAEASWGSIDGVTRDLLLECLGGNGNHDTISVLRELRGDYAKVRSRILAKFLAAQGKRYPWCALIDDIDKASSPTCMEFLDELALAARGLPILAVITAQPSFASRQKSFLVQAQEHTGWMLSPLSETDTSKLCHMLLEQNQINQQLTDDVWVKCEGNPGFVVDLAHRYLAEGVVGTSGINASAMQATRLPLSVEDAVEARISNLSDKQRRVLEMGAVFGNVFWASAIVSMFRLSDGGQARSGSFEAEQDPYSKAVLAIVEELVDNDYLLRLGRSDSMMGDDELVFKHNLERQQISSNTDAEHRNRYYRWAAQWLETRSGNEEQYEALAILHREAGDAASAGQFYLQAGARAKQSGQVERAVTLYRQAEEMLPPDQAASRFEVYRELGLCEELVGNMDAAQKQFAAMERLAWLYDNAPKGGVAKSRLGQIERSMGNLEGGERYFAAAKILFEGSGDKLGSANVMLEHGKLLLLRGDVNAAITLIDSCLPMLRDFGRRERFALAHLYLAQACQSSGDYRKFVEHLAESIRLQSDLSDRFGLIRSMLAMADSKLVVGQIHDARAHLDQCIGLAKFVGDRRAEAMSNLLLSELLFEQGDFSQSKALAAQSQTLSSRASFAVGIGEASRVLALTLAAEGNAEAAIDELKRASHMASGAPFDALLCRLEFTEAQISASFGDRQLGIEALRKRKWGNRNNKFEILRADIKAANLLERAGLSGDATRLRDSFKQARYGLQMAVKQRLASA